MKRKTYCWLIIIVLLFGILAGICIWQRNNITALWYALQYSVAEQQAMEQETNQVIQQISEQIAGVDFSALPQEAQELLAKGELSEEDAVAILTGKITWEEYKNNPQAIPSAEESSSRVEEIIAKIYVLRSGYTGKIDDLVNQALTDYRNKQDTKSALISKYVSLGYGLERECDGKMEALLTELTAELKRTDGDMGLVSQIRSAYRTEKSLKKAAIIAKYQK